MNVFTVAGRVTKDAEQRFTANEKAVLGFTVATDVGFGDKKHPLFIRCSLWGKRGEALAAYVLKGSPVTVSGELDLREWEANGKSGTSLELNVSEIALQGGKGGTAQRTEPQGGTAEQQRAAEGQGKSGFDDDDIPF